MARPQDDDLGPALLALGALGLGLAAIVAIWSARTPVAERAAAGEEPEVWGVWDGITPRGSRSASSDPDAGTAYRSAAGLRYESFLPMDDEPDDPQVLAMRRSFSDDAGMAADFTPYRHLGHAIAASGLAGVSDRSSCDVRMLPVRSEAGFNCVVRVRCDGVTVYPDSALEAGYAPCEVEGGVPRLATDRATTERDGDPALLVDLAGHRVRVRDLRYGAESMVEIQLD